MLLSASCWGKSLWLRWQGAIITYFPISHLHGTYLPVIIQLMMSQRAELQLSTPTLISPDCSNPPVMSVRPPFCFLHVNLPPVSFYCLQDLWCSLGNLRSYSWCSTCQPERWQVPWEFKKWQYVRTENGASCQEWSFKISWDIHQKPPRAPWQRL